jgi:hypothetical protein
MQERTINNQGKGKIVMLWFAAIVGVLLVFGFWLIASTSKHYKNLFDTPHLIEFAEGIKGVRRGALENKAHDGDDKPLSEEDSRVFVSSKEVAVSYTITEEQSDGETHFVHHYAISQAGRPTTHALGEFFAHYTALLLNLPGKPSVAFSSDIGVHHMEFTLNPAEQNEWEKKTVTIPTEETLPGIQQQIIERRDLVHFKTSPVPPPITERF